jgi:hypothetical protein
MEINLERRIASLEARQPNVKSAVQQFLEKCTGDELHQLEIIAEKTEIRGEPTPEESILLDGLEAEYGPLRAVE